jgi:lysozyme
MMPELDLVRKIDAIVRHRSVYVHDRVDQWRSFAKEMRADPTFQLKGDCDDWAQTALHWLSLEGVSKDRLYRAIVKSKGSRVPDHMIGLYRDDTGTYWSVGDTFGQSEPLHGKLIGGRVAGHEIVATAKLSEKLIWRGRLKRLANTANRGYRLSAKGFALLKSHERCVLRAYDDFQPNKVLQLGDAILGTLTIGYGHTGSDVHVGMKIGPDRAEALLWQDVQDVEEAIMQLIDVPLTQDQFDALVILVFNIGIGNFKSSTLRKKINAKATDPVIHAQFRRWIKSKGKVLQGLIRRREDEIKLWGGVVQTGAMVRVNVSATPMVEEHDKAIKSVSIWTQAVQVLMGFVSLIAAAGQFAPELHTAAKVSGFAWMAALAGGVTCVAAIALFIRRMYEIKVQAAK